MAKLIVVCGATGSQGGSVARRMLKEGWDVRAITRSVDGPAAQKLKSQGAELATANYDDEKSLIKAFEGANAIFGITNFFDYLFTLGEEGASVKESQQAMTIASAASKTGGLEHFILHALPTGESLAGPHFKVPHWDGKGKAAETIKKTLPDLAAKTTFLWIGWFASNLWAYEALKPVEIPGTHGSHAWIQPCKPDTLMPISGDIEHNVGAFVNAALRKPSISTPAKYAFVHTDVLRYDDVLKIWSEVTGRRATYIECTDEEATRLFSLFGTELAKQFRMNEVAPDWGAANKGDVLGAKELGISADDLIDFKSSLEKNKDKM